MIKKLVFGFAFILVASSPAGLRAGEETVPAPNGAVETMSAEPGPSRGGCCGGCCGGCGAGPGLGRGPGWGYGPGRGPAGDFQSDHDVFHFLLDNRAKIQRHVKMRANGVETLTESDAPEVAEMIREHVVAMHRRLRENRPIRRRDPLFDAVFRNAHTIRMELEPTEEGMRVIETSDDPEVVALIQAHAEVVSLFLKNGHAEARRDHAVPRTESSPR